MADTLLSGGGLIKPTASRYQTDSDPGSPEGMINQQADSMRKQIQAEFNTEWKSLTGRNGSKNDFGELHEKYRLRAAHFNQGISQKLAELAQRGPSALEQRLGAVTGLEGAGTMSPEQANEARTRMKIGPTAASVLYRKPEEPEDPMAEFGKLDVYRNRIESRIKDFRIRPGGRQKSWIRPSRFEKINVTELEIYDPTLLGKDKKGEYTGDWRKATLDEIKEYGALKKEQNRVIAAQRPLMSGMMNTWIKDPRAGGAIGQQASVYLKDKVEQPKQLDSSIAQQILQEAGGDKERARQIARSRGYDF